MNVTAVSNGVNIMAFILSDGTGNTISITQVIKNVEMKPAKYPTTVLFLKYLYFEDGNTPRPGYA